LSSKHPTAATDAIATVIGDAIGDLVGSFIAKGLRSTHALSATPAEILKASRAIPEAPVGTTVHHGDHAGRRGRGSPGATPEGGHWVTIHGHATYIDDDGKFHFHGKDSPASDPQAPDFHTAVHRALAHPVNGPGHHTPGSDQPEGHRFVTREAFRGDTGARHEMVMHTALNEARENPRRAARIDISPSGEQSVTTGTTPDQSVPTGQMSEDAHGRQEIPGTSDPDVPASSRLVEAAQNALVAAHARDLAQYAAHHRGAIHFGEWFRPVPRTAQWLSDYDRDYPPSDQRAIDPGSASSQSPTGVPEASGVPAPDADGPTGLARLRQMGRAVGNAVHQAASALVARATGSATVPPDAPARGPSGVPSAPAPADRDPAESMEEPDWTAVFERAFNRRDIRRADTTEPLADGNRFDARNPNLEMGDAVVGGREAFRAGGVPLPPGRSIAQYTDPETGNRAVAYFTEDPQVTTHPTAGAPYRISLTAENHGVVASYAGDTRDADSVLGRMRHFVHWADRVQRDEIDRKAGPPDTTGPRDTASSTTHDETDPAYLAAMQARDPLTARLFNRNADVGFTGAESPRMRGQWERGWFGRSLDPYEYAELVGCPDDHPVQVHWRGSSSFTITVNGKWFSQHRDFTREYPVSALNLGLVERPGEPGRTPYVEDGPRADAYNSTFFLKSPRPRETRANDTGQGLDKAPSGLGTRIIAIQLRKLQALGFARLHTGPIGNYSSSLSGEGSGYYAWPRMGYDSTLPRGFARGIERRKQRSDDVYEQETQRMAADPDYCPHGLHSPDWEGNPNTHPNYRRSTKPEPCEPPAGFADMRAMSQLMETPEGRAYWRAYGEGTLGYIDVRPGSPEMAANQKYLEDSGIQLGPAPRGR